MEKAKLINLDTLYEIENNIRSVTIKFDDGRPDRTYNTKEWCLFRKSVIRDYLNKGLATIDIAQK